MTSTTRYDESFVERDEVLFPNADVIDVEPHYDNFTAIQNALQQYDESQQMHTVRFIARLIHIFEKICVIF